MPCAFVVFLKTISDSLGPSDFGASREQKRAGRIPKDGFYTAHAMCILCGHEFGKKGPCFGFARGSGWHLTWLRVQSPCHHCKSWVSWEDIDFIEKAANVLRSYVDGAVGPCKTEISQQPVPLDAIVLEELLEWRSICPFGLDTDWVFGSRDLFGKLPVCPDSLRTKIL